MEYIAGKSFSFISLQEKLDLTLFSVRRSQYSRTEGQSEVSVLERCPYKRGHYDKVTFMNPLAVLSVQ